MTQDWNRRKMLQRAAAGSVLAISPMSIIGMEALDSAKKEEQEVTATEDLMREHGVIRRALLVYAEMAPKIRQNAASVDGDALRKTADLFRKFGEDYHERMLEEEHIFPAVRKMNKQLAHYADLLIEQHGRGREITDYILAVTRDGKISTGHAEPLARVFEGLVRMYENHAAREDTIIFPAWKKNYSNKQLDELGEKFEEIEQRTFGKDGFDDAEHTITGIEASLGLSELAQFTPKAPPKP